MLVKIFQGLLQPPLATTAGGAAVTRKITLPAYNAYPPARYLIDFHARSSSCARRPTGGTTERSPNLILQVHRLNLKKYNNFLL